MIRLIAQKAVTVTPSDTNYLTDEDGNKIIGSLYVGVSGDLVVLPWLNDDTDSSITTGVAGAKLYKSVPIGFFPVAVKKVFDTGTTATDLIVHPE